MIQNPSLLIPSTYDPTSEDFTSQMIQSLLRLRQIAEQLGVRLTPYSDSSIGKFKSLVPSIQRQHLASVDIWKDSYIEAMSKPANIIKLQGGDSLALRAAAMKFGFVIPEDFYSYIRQGDVIELYTFHGMNQEWRNMEFLRLSSYDVLTLLLHSMDELFYRDDEISQVITQRLQELAADPRPRPCVIPAHLICEKMHTHNNTFKIVHNAYAPVQILDGPVVGFVSTLRASYVGSLHDEAPNVRPLRR
ncbi:MAG: hypothetical protein NDI61_07685 [Bdellovibrionaceae bacterium]|nr:hypothetical protein [Pseudobdellovibrionaceae bacterium]